jgi:hypothetical protein
MPLGNEDNSVFLFQNEKADFCGAWRASAFNSSQIYSSLQEINVCERHGSALPALSGIALSMTNDLATIHS